DRFRLGRRRRRAALAARGAAFALHGLGFLEAHPEFPLVAVRVLRPEFVGLGVAAHHFLFIAQAQARFGRALAPALQVAVAEQLDAEVAHGVVAAGDLGGLHQREVQGGLVEAPVGVVGLHLAGGDAEQRRVKTLACLQVRYRHADVNASLHGFLYFAASWARLLAGTQTP